MPHDPPTWLLWTLLLLGAAALFWLARNDLEVSQGRGYIFEIQILPPRRRDDLEPRPAHR